MRDLNFAVIEPTETPRPSTSAGDLVTVQNQLDTANLQNKLADLEKLAKFKNMDEEENEELDTGDIGSTKDFNVNSTPEVDMQALGMMQSLQQ